MTHVTLDEPWKKVWPRPLGTYFAYFTRELEMRIVAHYTRIIMLRCLINFTFAQQLFSTEQNPYLVIG